MKKWLKEIVLWIIFVIIVSNIISYVRKPDIHFSQFPFSTVALLDGSTYQIQKDKPLLIHFWATWCPVCKLEADNIERLSKKYNVLTIAVNSGNNEKIRKYLKQKGLTFRVLNDPKGMWAQTFNVKVFPTTFIYNSGGKLKFTEVGYTSTAGLLARMALVR